MLKSFKSYCLLLMLCGTVLMSCQKEAGFVEDLDPVDNPNNPPPAGGIQGNWKFLYMDVETKSSMAFEESGASMLLIVTSKYRTIDNVGIIKITADKFSYDDLSYAVDGVAEETLFIDGVKADEYQFPFEGVMPPLDNSVGYSLVDDDTIKFAAGLMMVPDANGSTSSNPVGEQEAEYKVVGKIMTIKSKYKSLQVVPDPDGNLNMEIEAESIVTLEKL